MLKPHHRALWFTGICVVACALPRPAWAQSVGWSASALVLFDTEFSDATEVGPGVGAEVTLGRHQTFSYFLAVTAARTDFPLGADQLHRNYASAAVGLRWSPPRAGPRVGALLGLGMLAWDDVSETDPSFRSSADAAEMLLAGVELSVPVSSRWSLTASISERMTGWWWAILDPAEGALKHQIVLAVGVRGG